MATDLSPFTSKTFDPKDYINDACADRPVDETLERHLAELEMKLHLAAEDLSLYLEDCSSRAVQRIPAAANELLGIKDDVAAVRAAAASAQRQLESANDGAAAAVATIERLDAVKRRMEAACSTLQEAAGLSSLFRRVDDLFVSGDLQRVAEALAGIRRGLALVGGSVPEFRNGPARLGALQDRLAAAAEAPLAKALAAQRTEEAASLASILLGVGRRDAVERLYCSARYAPLAALWDSHAAGSPFVSWLVTFYDQAARTIESEAAWVVAALPDLAASLALRLLTSFLERTDKAHRARLAAALQAAQSPLAAIELLEQAGSAAADFAEAAHSALGAAGAPPAPGAFRAAQAAALAPAEAELLRYAEREGQYVAAQLAAAAPKGGGGGGGGADAVASAIEAATGTAVAAMEAALSRCMALTRGTALPALARALDAPASKFVAAAAQAAVDAADAVAAEARGDGDEGGGAAEGVLPLLPAAATLQRALAGFDAALRRAAAETTPVLLAATNEASAADQPASRGELQGLPSAAVLRLTGNPLLRQQLAGFAGAAAAGVDGATALPAMTAAAGKLGARVESVALEALSERIKEHLQPVPSLPEWTAGQGPSALPTFSAYPLQYVTALGEHLMLLPQILEAGLVPRGGNEGAVDADDLAGLVGEWVDKVALSSSSLYLSTLRALPSLSSGGAAQLAADLEYFANVLATLGVDPPAELAAWQAAAGAPPDAIGAVVAAAAGGGAAEARRAVELVARLRGLAL